MEAPTSDLDRSSRSLIHRWLHNRWARWPLWLAGGIAVSFLVAVIMQPNWVEFCSRIDTRSQPCAPIDLTRMFGYVLIAVGFFVMILGPVVNSLYHLFRYGQKWETSRVETAVSNLPLASGLLFLVLGFFVAWMSG